MYSKGEEKHLHIISLMSDFENYEGIFSRQILSVFLDYVTKSVRSKCGNWGMPYLEQTRAAVRTSLPGIDWKILTSISSGHSRSGESISKRLYRAGKKGERGVVVLGKRGPWETSIINSRRGTHGRFRRGFKK